MYHACIYLYVYVSTVILTVHALPQALAGTNAAVLSLSPLRTRALFPLTQTTFCQRHAIGPAIPAERRRAHAWQTVFGAASGGGHSLLAQFPCLS